jgi:hypothetical protein
MNPCPKCQHKNKAGILYCESCGTMLTKGHKPLTTSLNRSVYDTRPSPQPKGGRTKISTDDAVLLCLRDTGERIFVSLDKPVILGRSDPESSQMPDVDLVGFGAKGKGVSRFHARLEVDDNTLVLIDMDSANGTFLNGDRLIPEQPRITRDGDELRLGKLVLRILFRATIPA